MEYNNGYTTGMRDTYSLLQELGLSEAEIEVYLALHKGATSASEVIKVTGRKKPTVYYALSALKQRGLIQKTEGTSSTTVRVEPPDTLIALADDRVRKANTTADEVRELVPNLQQEAGSESARVALFEGPEAVRMQIMYSLYTRDRMIYSIVPKANFFWDVGKDFVEEYVTERIARGIATKNVWGNHPGQKVLDAYYKDLSEVRILPSDMRDAFTTCMFVFDSTTLYISSKKNGYCIVVNSHEHATAAKALFEMAWRVSK